MPQLKNLQTSHRLLLYALAVAAFISTFIYGVAIAERSSSYSADDPLPTQALGTIRTITLATKDLIVDKSTQRIYASVPGNVL